MPLGFLSFVQCPLRVLPMAVSITSSRGLLRSLPSCFPSSIHFFCLDIQQRRKLILLVFQLFRFRSDDINVDIHDYRVTGVDLLSPCICGKLSLPFLSTPTTSWKSSSLPQIGMIGFNKKLQQAEINGTYTRTEQERTERLQIRWAGYLVVYIITWALVLPLNVAQYWGDCLHFITP